MASRYPLVLVPFSECLSSHMVACIQFLRIVTQHSMLMTGHGPYGERGGRHAPRTWVNASIDENGKPMMVIVAHTHEPLRRQKVTLA